jgi:hypothetical protein
MEEIMRNCFAELHMKIAVAGTPETDVLLLHAKTSGKIDVHATRSHASACARKSKRFSLNLLTDCEQNGKTIMHDSLARTHPARNWPHKEARPQPEQRLSR